MGRKKSKKNKEDDKVVVVEDVSDETRCGIGPLCSGKRMQSLANKKSYLLTYSFLGLFQSMFFSYSIATLTTLEKQFKLKSQTTGKNSFSNFFDNRPKNETLIHYQERRVVKLTAHLYYATWMRCLCFVNFSLNIRITEWLFFWWTGILLSGNECSQILLSLVMTYFGGQGHRPRLAAIGVFFSGISSLLIVVPHFVYGRATLVTNGKSRFFIFYKTTDQSSPAAASGSNHAGSACEKENKNRFSFVSCLYIYDWLGTSNRLYKHHRDA